MDTLKQAKAFLQTVTKLAESYGDTWQVNYDPAENDGGKPEFNGTIWVNHDIDEDTRGYNIPLGIPDDEDFAKLICYIFNNSWSLIDELVDEIERLQQPATTPDIQADFAAVCAERGRHEWYGRGREMVCRQCGKRETR
jgi:hypothetical protein